MNGAILLIFSLPKALAYKKGIPTEIGHNYEKASIKIHAAVDTYSYPVRLIIGEGHR